MSPTPPIPVRIARRYSFVFPRRYDEPRPRWPEAFVAELDGLPGLVAWVASDACQAWAQDGDDAIARESRTRRLEVDLEAGTELELGAGGERLLELAGRLRDDAGLDRVRVASWPITVSTLLRP